MGAMRTLTLPFCCFVVGGGAELVQVHASSASASVNAGVAANQKANATQSMRQSIHS